MRTSNMEYTLESTFERQGDWFIDESRKIAGTISFTSEGCYLDLSGSLQLLKKGRISEEVLRYQMIYGITTKGEAITLLEGFRTNITINANSGGPRINEKVYCQKIVIGAHIPQNWLCKEMSFKIPALQVWMGYNSISKNSNNDTNKKNFEFIRPEKYTISMQDHCNISWFASCQDRSDSYSSINFEVFGLMEIKHASGQSLEWFLDQHHKISSLIALLSGHAMSPNAIKFSVPERNSYSSLLISLSDSSNCNYKNPIEFFLTRKMLDNNFTGIVKKWFELYDKARDSIQLTMSILSSKDLWLHVRFLSLMQALEGFHRSRSDDLYTSPEKYDFAIQALNDAIPDNLSNDHKKSLKSRIRYGNEVSLNKRLNCITSLLSDEICKAALGASKVPRKWVDTRNYYTHWDKNSKKTILNNRELYSVCKRLELLLRLVWLIEAGVSSELIISALNGTSNLALTIKQINKNN